MTTHFMTEIGRQRDTERLIRAERYRRAIEAARRLEDDGGPSRVRSRRPSLRFMLRRGLAPC